MYTSPSTIQGSAPRISGDDHPAGAYAQVPGAEASARAQHDDVEAVGARGGYRALHVPLHHAVGRALWAPEGVVCAVGAERRTPMEEV
jgi:hypothetical protein